MQPFSRIAAKHVLKTGVSSLYPAMGTVVVFSFFINLLAFTSPLYMLQIYDRVIGSRSDMTLLVITCLVGYLLIVNALLEMLRSRMMVQASLIVDGKIATAIFDATHAAGMNFPQLTQGQSLRDLDSLRDFIGGPGLIALCDLLWMPIFIFACFLIHPWFGFIAIVGSLVILALTFASEVATTKPLGLAARSSMEATQKAVSSLRNSEAIRAMGMLGAMRDAWLKRHSTALVHQAAASGRSALIGAGSKFVRMYLQTMILGVGAYLAIHNEISAGMIIAASIFVGKSLGPVEGVVANWKGLSHARGSYRRLAKLFAIAGDEKFRVALPNPIGHLRVEGVSAAPPEQQQAVLRHVSFEALPGEVIGVVGPSAAGKSSLARVITGVWPIGAGHVRLDGADLSHWDPELRGPHMGYLPQDIELFSGSIAENIGRFGRGNDDAVIETAQLCGCHDMIQLLPDGYNTAIGDGGAALSAGQRQRIGLARAFYNRPCLVVLDEPNASLDQEGEEALLEAVRRYRSFGTTVILITHKRDVLAVADKILMLNNGVVQAFGERDDVLSQLNSRRPMRAVV